ncbi:hypothetical protein DICPUDRAFT_96532 [Dictyostelium purpureum]|uniref:Phosphoinositide phospholipase C n=1 Tax=Dictyostelium purpureum TaxID=5786 RepID=F0Z941_DICPU|nr:uncharacterized protein DICPUDRAFT_96532 [Dictyostelium purpureum]EGC39488.1 hypothetical protein DICPUDRAFT_96532 [Dictyostelium purpureum]|eukprot:XP_003283935.1 hypothetical protein DICPUDRAFT_96532 [Dictyostelium purpureum]
MDNTLEMSTDISMYDLKQGIESIAEELYNIQSFNNDVILDSYDIDDYDHTQLEIDIDFQKYKSGLPILKISSKGKSQKKKLIFDLEKNQIICGKKKKVNFSEIDEIRVGHKTNIFNQFVSRSKDEESKKTSFSILFSGNLRKSMDFICASIEERRIIVSALYHIVQDSKSVNNEYNFVKKEWDSIGKDTIDFSTLKKVLARLNFSTSDVVLQGLMKFTDTNCDYHLDFSEFSNLLKLLRSHPELKPVFFKYAQGRTDIIPIHGMIQFFKEEQKEEWTIEMCKNLIEKYHHERLDYISFENFEEYLTGDQNLAIYPRCNGVYQDTTRPLTHYFINSSHNTYLSGHQLKGLSTSEMYTYQLRQGCKCVELDVWDGNDGDPIIFHGNTLTSQIKFSHVLQTIKSRGFETSPYPVILSLEVHCSIPQQIIMAQHMKDIFGEMLAMPLPEGSKEFPSLESMKFKILLKGHISKTPGSSTSSSSLGSLAGALNTSSTNFSNEASSSSTTTTTTTTSTSGSNYTTDDDDGAVDFKNDEEPDIKSSSSSFSLGSSKKKPTKEKVAPELSSLIYLVSHSFKSASNTKELPCYLMHSLSEEKVKALVQTDSKEMIMASHEHFFRAYPKGTRFDSSNFDPSPGWSIGNQMIALNQQTSSEPMWINDGMFTDNGGCGYVLKPPCLLPEGCEGFDPSSPERAPLSKYSRLIVTVISARQLPKYTKTTKGEVIDPYVTLSVYGSHYDQKTEKTRVIDNNGFNPHWGEEFEFPLYNSQLAMLLIRVDDKDKVGHNRIGHYCIRVENIRPGYRMIRLKNNFNRSIPLASLLCKFRFEE